MAQIVEVHRALEKIKDESHQWNVSLQSLVLKARAGRVPQKSPTEVGEKENGLALVRLTR